MNLQFSGGIFVAETQNNTNTRQVRSNNNKSKAVMEHLVAQGHSATTVNHTRYTPNVHHLVATGEHADTLTELRKDLREARNAHLDSYSIVPGGAKELELKRIRLESERDFLVSEVYRLANSGLSDLPKESLEGLNGLDGEVTLDYLIEQKPILGVQLDKQA